MNAPNLIVAAFLLILGIAWYESTIRAGVKMMMIGSDAIGFVVWLAAIVAGWWLGDTASFVVGLTWN